MGAVYWKLYGALFLHFEVTEHTLYSIMLNLIINMLLCNQPIQIHNIKSEDKKPLLTAEELELLTVPADLAEYKNAIMAAMTKGTNRIIESEDNQKNAVTAE